MANGGKKKERHGDFMDKQIYTSNPNYTLISGISSTRLRFFLNNENHLYKIVRYSATSHDEIKETTYESSKQENWTFDEVNKNDLIRFFTELALGNPADFKDLYLALKGHDEVTFPLIKQTLQEVQELFNFN